KPAPGKDKVTAGSPHAISSVAKTPMRFPSRSFFLPLFEPPEPPPTADVFNRIPILFTLSSQSSGTLPNFSASIAMRRISFSANQCVISLIWFCCSDNLKSIIPLHLLYRLLKFVRLFEEANPFHDRIASPEPKHLVPIFLPDTPGYNHAHQEVERLNQ